MHHFPTSLVQRHLFAPVPAALVALPYDPTEVPAHSLCLTPTPGSDLFQASDKNWVKSPSFSCISAWEGRIWYASRGLKQSGQRDGGIFTSTCSAGT